MQKAKVLSIILAMGLLFTLIQGCTTRVDEPQEPPPGAMQLPPGTEPGVEEPEKFIPADDPDGENPLIDPEAEARLLDCTWISPGKVIVSGLYQGARAEAPELPPLRIHNGNEVATSFMLTVRPPDYVENGYEPLPEEYYTWITITDPTPLIPPKSTIDVLLQIAVLDDVPSGKRYEIWISIIDLGQTGDIRTELCSRWFLNIRA